jgi:hypothetical protein
MVQKINEMRQDPREVERRKILVITSLDRFSNELREYSTHLAERLDCDLLVLSVGPLWNQESFARRAEREARDLKRRAALVGVHCEHIVKFGDAGLAIDDVKSQAKRIAFVVADTEVGRSDGLGEFTIPVFTVSSKTEAMKGDRIMNAKTSSRGNLLVRTASYGLLSAGLYTLVFMNADTVMSFFTRGGLHAALPIATVFVFSFAHGAFASNLWSLLGIEAARKDVLTQTEKKVVQSRKRAQKRPRAYTYVNPFHRM